MRAQGVQAHDPTSHPAPNSTPDNARTHLLPEQVTVTGSVMEGMARRSFMVREQGWPTRPPMCMRCSPHLMWGTGRGKQRGQRGQGRGLATEDEML